MSTLSVGQQPTRVRSLPMGVWLWRILLGALLLMLALSLLTWLAGAWAKATLARQYPAPGQRLDVGGYALHLNCTGQGSPTVILEAGLNDFSVQWATVQPEVSRFARVCTYDRAGLGWSDDSPQPRTRQTMVDELHRLLAAAGVDGPLLLVGHSFGGMVMRDYAQRYAHEVVGLVLVDAAHEGQLARNPALHRAYEQLLAQFKTLATLSSFGLLALSPAQIPNRGLPPEALAQYRAVLATRAYFRAAHAESEAFYAMLKEAPADALTPLGDLPLIVVSRGKAEPLPAVTAAESDQMEVSWQQMQAELVALSSNSQQIIARESGHDIHLQQPDLVVQAIRQLLHMTQAN